MRGLALTYTQLLDELDLTGVTVIGNSIGAGSRPKWPTTSRKVPRRCRRAARA